MRFDWPTLAALRTLALIVAVLAAAAALAVSIVGSVDSTRTAAALSSQRTSQRTALLIAVQEQQLQEALLGECQGRNALTSAVDATHKVVHETLLQVSRLTFAAARQERRRKLIAVELHLAAWYAVNAAMIRKVTITDCGQELAHPLTYLKPAALPFK